MFLRLQQSTTSAAEVNTMPYQPCAEEKTSLRRTTRAASLNSLWGSWLIRMQHVWGIKCGASPLRWVFPPSPVQHIVELASCHRSGVTLALWHAHALGIQLRGCSTHARGPVGAHVPFSETGELGTVQVSVILAALSGSAGPRTRTSCTGMARPLSPVTTVAAERLRKVAAGA